MSDSALIDDLERQFAENPRRVFARLANEYRKAGDAERAIEICRAHVPQQPGYISGHIVLGQALFDTGRFDEAKEAFETALSLDPENLIALRQLGDIARETGDSADARSWYRRLLDVDPQNEEIAAQLAALDASAETLPDAPAPDADAMAEQEPVSWGDIHPEGVSIEPQPAAPDVALPDVAVDMEEAFPNLLITHSPDGVWDGGQLEPEPVAPEPQPMGAYEAAAVPPEEPIAAPIGFEPTTIDESLGSFDPPAIPSDDPFVGVAAPEQVPSWSDDAAAEEPATDAASPMTVEALDAPGVDASTTPVSADGVLPDAFVTETMADIYVQQGFNERALDVYRQLAEQSPGNPRFQEQIAALQEKVAAAQAQNARSAASLARDGDASPGAPRHHSAPTIHDFLSAIAARRVAAAPGEWTPEPVAGSDADDVAADAAPDEARGSFEVPPVPEESEPDTARPVREKWEPDTAPAVHEESDASPEPTANDGVPAREAASPHHEPPASEAPSDAPSEAPSMDGTAAATHTVDELLPGWTATADDETDVRSALAEAYASDGDEGDGRDGRPAHRAIDELSLDAVFRDAPGRERTRPEGPSVSFDEFFADENGAHDSLPEANGGIAQGEAGSSADLELFHAWLEGLKK